MNNAEVLVKFKGDTKDLDQKTEKANGAIKGLSSGLKGALAVGATVAATAVIATTKAVVDLTKASVEAYADFEQLAGGIDKLYGASADKVMDYANDAYRTVGMTANQYMSSTTAFSAKLIRDLGGDTSKAADYADKAMRQIADNANTYGKYTIDELTGVYQALAKGMYTTLDNLNLGFAGSKTGMQELLDYAEQLSGKKFNIENFTDIVDAIGIVQDELNITNTTVNEAKGTITGSLNMMKASWGNFITELAKPNADIGRVIDELISSAMTFADNIVPVATRAVEGIANALPQIAQKIGDLLPGLVEKLLPPLIDAILKLTESLAKNLPSIIMSLSKALIQAVAGLVKVLPDIIDGLLKAVIAIIQALAEALPDLLPAIIDAILGIIPILIENIPLFIKAGVQLIVGLVNGILQSIPQLLSSGKKIVVSLINELKNLPMQVLDIGKNLIMGLWNGISNHVNWIVNKIKGLGKKVLNAAKSIFGIHSPSTEFAWMGKMNILGLEQGMENMQPELQRTINGMFDLQPNVSGTMNNSLSPNLNVVVNNNMEVDPLGQVVNKIKTFSGGAKNDYNWGATI